MGETKAAWRNRIVRHAVVPADEIMANPRNWRVHTDHQREALEGVLDRVGWVQDVIVNQRTGLLVDGELRVTAAARRGESVPVKYVDLSEEEEALMLAAIDPLGALALTDEAQLAALLGDIDMVDPALDQMFYALVEHAGNTSLKDEPPEPIEGEESADGTKQKRNLGSPGVMIKPVLYASQVGLFEQALRATGCHNRGEAVLEVCRVYLEQQEREEGQLDLSVEV